jgi:hypothetical protein
MAAPTDTRLGPGTLTIGGTEFGAQLANVTLSPSQDSNDGTPTLGDPDPLPEITESWELSGSAIQDFEDPLGFVNYCMDNALTVKPFVWTPNTDAAVEYAGDVLVTSIEIGGDVSAQNASDFTFAVQGVPVRTDAPGGAPAGGSRAAAAARARRRSSLAVAAPAVKREKGTK